VWTSGVKCSEGLTKSVSVIIKRYTDRIKLDVYKDVRLYGC
jgi:hypothetical protein